MSNMIYDNSNNDWKSLSAKFRNQQTILDNLFNSIIELLQGAAKCDGNQFTPSEWESRKNEILNLFQRTSNHIIESQQILQEIQSLDHLTSLESARSQRFTFIIQTYQHQYQKAMSMFKLSFGADATRSKSKNDQHFQVEIDNKMNQELIQSLERGELQKENNIIYSSIALIENTIKQSSLSLNNLNNQRKKLVTYGQSLNQYKERFTHIHNTIKKIKYYKKKKIVFLTLIFMAILFLYFIKLKYNFFS